MPVYYPGGGGGGGGDPALEGRVALLETRAEGAASSIDDLNSRVQALETRQTDFDAPRPEMQEPFDEPRNP